MNERIQNGWTTQERQGAKEFVHHQLSIYESASTALVIGTVWWPKRTISRVEKAVNGLKLNIKKWNEKWKRGRGGRDRKPDGLVEVVQFFPFTAPQYIYYIHKQKTGAQRATAVVHRAIKALLKSCKFSIKRRSSEHRKDTRENYTVKKRDTMKIDLN